MLTARQESGLICTVRSSTLDRTVAVAWALGVLLFLPAAAQAGFEEPIKVTPSGADPFGYPSDVGFDQSGGATVETVSEGHILLYTRPPGGSFSGGSIGSGTKASMAVSADGAAVTVWRESATMVQIDYRSSSGGAFTSAASFPGAAVGNVAAGIDANGNAVVVWKDGAIHYSLSTGGSFGAEEGAPLGATPGFEGRGEDPQRDHGPRAFRDNAGNVLLAYRDAANATVAHRAPNGTWDTALLPGGAATDMQADADPTSQRLIVGYTTSGTFRAFAGSTSSSTGAIVVEQPASTNNIMSVAVQRGGAVDAVFWSDGSSKLRSASCLSGFATETVAPSVGAGVIGAVTSGADLIAYYPAAPGLERASRLPGGAWTDTPFEVNNFGTIAVGVGYNGDALGLFVDYPSDTGITGFPYSGTATSSATCAAPNPNPSLSLAAPSVAGALPEVKKESPPGPPTLAVSGNVAPVSGKVSVRLPGASKFVPLSSLRQIPFGSVIEATSGVVSVTTALPGGKIQTGEFFKGEFILTQERSGRVIATLTGGNFAVCPTKRERAHVARVGAGLADAGFVQARAKTAASGSHVVRKLWANAHGKFSTKGNYAAGAVQGTEWLTEDLCDGTLIKVTRDRVAVTNLVNHRHVEVSTGHHYLAKAR
jgi:hypothetical protein